MDKRASEHACVCVCFHDYGEREKMKGWGDQGGSESGEEKEIADGGEIHVDKSCGQ